MPRKKGLSHFSTADEMKTGLSSLSAQGSGQNVLLLPMAGDGCGSGTFRSFPGGKAERDGNTEASLHTAPV
ncbi:hypothetical protein CXU19_09865 [Akkermansia muciniphila]|nr:hypothetical protein CXU19_09865 [Akkermansia muciniphila]PNC38736.1 hypothetical protein CXU20_09600 [Akkermansia muciniphila]